MHNKDKLIKNCRFARKWFLILGVVLIGVSFPFGNLVKKTITQPGLEVIEQNSFKTSPEAQNLTKDQLREKLIEAEEVIIKVTNLFGKTISVYSIVLFIVGGVFMIIIWKFSKDFLSLIDPNVE